MDSDSGHSKILKPIHLTLAGASSGIVTRLLCQPLDVLKIRFQLQSYKLSTKTLTYTGLGQALHHIVAEEGVAALWKGHLPAQVLSILYGAIQFTVFETCNRAALKRFPDHADDRNKKAALDFACGGVGGVSASFFCQPVDVLRTRLVAQGEPKVYKSISHAVRSMMLERGVRTFYRGIGPTILLVFPNAGLNFAFYGFYKHLWSTYMISIVGDEQVQGKRLICGALAGLCSKVVLLPLDLIKKRLEIQGFQEASQHLGEMYYYRSALHCASEMIKKEGFFSLYRGISPSVAKAAATAALSFYVYEQSCDILEWYVWWKEGAR